MDIEVDPPFVLMMVVSYVTSSVEDGVMLMDVNDVVPEVTEKRGIFNLLPSAAFRMNERSVNETVDALRRKIASPEVIAATDLWTIVPLDEDESVYVFSPLREICLSSAGSTRGMSEGAAVYAGCAGV